ncbi:uncharacterized protein LOC119339402 [Triticum dicoccoides]|uniref:uncharacterized protein LOC119339402 n=1 Tax=Triticum dicoccoides TaxID=85692 RepID=UPI001890F7B6|nr:uncharacterized protein LOC119339402 [Triticum dicoccoides]
MCGRSRFLGRTRSPQPLLLLSLDAAATAKPERRQRPSLPSRITRKPPPPSRLGYVVDHRDAAVADQEHQVTAGGGPSDTGDRRRSETNESAPHPWVSMLNGDADGCPSSTNKLEIPSPAEITSRVERESTP